MPGALKILKPDSIFPKSKQEAIELHYLPSLIGRSLDSEGVLDVTVIAIRIIATLALR